MTLKNILVVFAVCLVLVVAKKSPEQEAVEKEAKLAHKKYNKYEQGKYSVLVFVHHVLTIQNTVSFRAIRQTMSSWMVQT